MSSPGEDARTVRVVALQASPARQSRQETLEQELVRTEQVLGAERPQFLTLSELATSPYFCGLDDDAWFDWAEPVPGPATEAFGRLARTYDCHIVLPLFERAGNRFFNAAAVIGPDGHPVTGRDVHGTELPAYRKIHLPTSLDELTGRPRSNEPRYFSAGDHVLSFDTAHGRVGILICWDKRFTELWRMLGLLEVDLVFNPICTWGAWRDRTYPLELQVMALQNQYFVAGCSKGGVEQVGERLAFSGGAHLAAPDGALLSSVPSAPGGYAVADLDLAEVATARRTTAIYPDRRPEVYDPLTKRR